ncbi:MAG: methylmalonyl Co-A mutase-associated GTPase MeaB [candidate division WOR-3 bacterium]
MTVELEQLLRRFEQGDRRACGQLMSLVENQNGVAQEILHRLYPKTGRAYCVGITGPPGAGKSTLVEKLALGCRQQGMRVGVVAVDPTSPFSGGAILGDRVRMTALFLDSDVFIRSMGSRGSLGGLALKTREVCSILDAFGKDIVLIETIGVGQVELDIARAADTTVVVLVPESGDSIQAMKAGLMEIGNLFAVNKADRDGADRVALEISAVLETHARGDAKEWRPRVVRTVATQGAGVDELLSGIWEHRQWLERTQGLTRRRLDNARQEVVELVEHELCSSLWQNRGVRDALDAGLEAIARRETTPYELARRIIGLARTGKALEGEVCDSSERVAEQEVS